MKTPQECKEQVAREEGYKDWSEVVGKMSTFTTEKFNQMIDRAIDIYTSQVQSANAQKWELISVEFDEFKRKGGLDAQFYVWLSRNYLPPYKIEHNAYTNPDNILLNKLNGMRKFASANYNSIAAVGALTVIDEIVRFLQENNKQIAPKYYCNIDRADFQYGNCDHPSNCQKKVKQPAKPSYYKGRGEHSVSQLENIVEQQAEELHQLKVKQPASGELFIKCPKQCGGLSCDCQNGFIPYHPTPISAEHCEKMCGENHCDTNGCVNRKRNLVDEPISADVDEAAKEYVNGEYDRIEPSVVSRNNQEKAFKAGYKLARNQRVFLVPSELTDLGYRNTVLEPLFKKHHNGRWLMSFNSFCEALKEIRFDVKYEIPSDKQAQPLNKSVDIEAEITTEEFFRDKFKETLSEPRELKGFVFETITLEQGLRWAHQYAQTCWKKKPAINHIGHRQNLRDLVDLVWNESTGSKQVPSTKWADRLIDQVFKNTARIINKSTNPEQYWEICSECNGDFLNVKNSPFCTCCAGFRPVQFPINIGLVFPDEQACLREFANVGSEHCLYDNYKKGFDDCINLMRSEIAKRVIDPVDLIEWFSMKKFQRIEHSGKFKGGNFSESLTMEQLLTEYTNQLNQPA